MIAQIKHIQRRRADLRRDVDVISNFEEWEESCVPSYCHSNWVAAYISWIRLFHAAQLAHKFGSPTPRVLDFGSSVGELGHLVAPDGTDYDFVEADDHSSDFLRSRLPNARRVSLEEAPQSHYDLVFAIDALEHNTNFAEILEVLVTKLRPGGCLILSGPTENALYRLGRRIAGFDGHYHETTIYEIEAAAAKVLNRSEVRSVMPIAPLFRISAWR